MNTQTSPSAIGLVGFDGDDTLWKSEDYYQKAEHEFGLILSNYIDLHDAGTAQHLLKVQRRNLAVFGYGAKGMTLSMLEAAIELTNETISAHDLRQIVEIGRRTLEHPVDVIDGVRDAVAAIAAEFPVVLITKGDLFHQEQKIERSGLLDLFPRIEIVSEKDPGTYAKVLAEFNMPAERFVMVGNSLRSDIEPVLGLGGWGIHTPYAMTWAHEAEHGVSADEPRLHHADTAHQWPEAVRAVAAQAAAAQGG
ncbi:MULTISPECIES: HAD family hydrolase [Stenotrophomonas]|uniref:HAD family hydrolase n=1 Tax=Stenotrophomonas TaxID=40323 RepID=UPI0007704935|nr:MULTISPECIES: HAD family hydrolase [Stenotrophomonas]AMJ58007.1 haloacid dehalogenase [Stenotrophomonas sp. KCTC 12332]